jgi:hypothetical protein
LRWLPGIQLLEQLAPIILAGIELRQARRKTGYRCVNGKPFDLPSTQRQIEKELNRPALVLLL